MTKIAFVDSGIGGLFFAIDAIRNIRTDEVEVIHVADNKNMPYGNKDHKELKSLTNNLMQTAVNLGAKKIFIACNTACTVVGNDLAQQYKNNGVDVISIISKSAVALYHQAVNINGAIDVCIFATKNTISSNRYQNEIKTLHRDKDAQLIMHTFCPDSWASRIEDGIGHQEAKNLVYESLDKFCSINVNWKNLSNIGLFCTHYIYFQELIYQYFEEKYQININLISQGNLFDQEISTKENSESQKHITSYATKQYSNAVKSLFIEKYPDVKVDFKSI